MSETLTNMSVWVGDESVCIKIAGRAGLHSSIEFKDVVNLLRKKGHARFVLDLSECVLMDSTFLGVLARMGINAAQTAADQSATSIELLNPNQRVRELIDTLGVTEYFTFLQGRYDGLQHLEPLEQKVAPADPKELARTSLEAHNALMKLNPNNVPKFKDVAKFLADELNHLDNK